MKFHLEVTFLFEKFSWMLLQTKFLPYNYFNFPMDYFSYLQSNSKNRMDQLFACSSCGVLLKSRPGTWIQTLKNLDPGKPGPQKS